jgi:hypothetical protein
VSARIHGVVALVILLGASGCALDGTVTVRNESGTEFVGSLDGRGIALSGAESIQKNIKVGTKVFFFGPDEKTVEFEGESCTCFPFRRDVVVKDNGNTVATIEPDAVCVIFRNDSQYEVIETVMRDADATEWGPNLVDPLFPSTTLTLRIAPGIYDFLMVDECGDSTEVQDAMVISGNRRDVTHRGLESCPGAGPG